MSPTFKCDDFARRVHDGAICRDGPADGGVRVRHVDDHHLCLFSDLLPDTDELIRLHRQGAEPDVGWVDPQILKLGEKEKKKETNFICFNLNFCIIYKWKLKYI